MNDLMDNQGFKELKKSLQTVEGKILKLCETDEWGKNQSTMQKAWRLIESRHKIMDRMFRLHVTEQETCRFREINDHLLAMTIRMFDEHRRIFKFHKYTLPSFMSQDDAVLVNTIRTNVPHSKADSNKRILRFDDEEYGSAFAEIIEAIGWCGDSDIWGFANPLSWKPEYPLKNGRSCDKGKKCLSLPQFENIDVCFIVHGLCNRMKYSVPDLLRMTSYQICHELRTATQVSTETR